MEYVSSYASDIGQSVSADSQARKGLPRDKNIYYVKNIFLFEKIKLWIETEVAFFGITQNCENQ